MEPEAITPSKGKKFLKITLGVLSVLVVLLGIAFILTALKNAKQTEVQVVTPALVVVKAEEKISTESGKLKVLEGLSVSSTTTQKTSTTAYPNAGTSSAVDVSSQVIKERMQILQNLSPDTTNPTISDEEKLRILNSMSL